MKAAGIFLGTGLWLLPLSLQAQPGLKGEYYTGTNFDRKVFSRIDPQLNFNWSEGSPGAGMPHSYYSVRWTGKLLAPATGEYRFYANVDDGIRVWINGKKVIDSWQLNNSEKYSGAIVLKAGTTYELRVDYFNDMLGGKLELFWSRPDARKIFTDPLGKPVKIPGKLIGELITANFFTQKVVPPQITAPKLPEKPGIKNPTVAVKIPPKAAPQKQPVLPRPKPSKPTLKTTSAGDSVNVTYVPIYKAAIPLPASLPAVDMKPDTMFNLRPRNIQFEQSSYVLLPESGNELDELVKVLKRHPDWIVSISGHTDNVGNPHLNLALSEYRAKVVANYLIRQGIAESRMTTAGYGETRPVSDNTTEEGRSRNRHVIIIRR